MSMLLMVKAMQTKVGNPLRKLVLIKLADNANDQGECWPSLQYIADQCEISKRSVIRHVEDLCNNGFLIKKERSGGFNGQRSNLYVLSIGGDRESLIANVKKEVVTESHSGGDRESLIGGDRESPRISHSFNQSINHILSSVDDSQSAAAELPDAGDKKKSSTAKQPVVNYQAFADSYNEILGDRLPTCAVMSDKRKRALKKLLPLLKAPTLECFSAYLNAFAHTARPFYFGENDRGWRASFDFVLRQDTLTATKEGSIADSRLEIEGDDE